MPRYVENLRKRKPTGGVRVPNRGRRAYEQHGYPVDTKVGQELRFLKRCKGGGYKVKCVTTSYANVVDPVSKQARKVKILKLLLNPASRDLTRRGVITKGALLETELGQAKVTSRPGQDGIVNAVLVKR
ncbi:MAG: 30S ribosomal protein S8e [Nitrososphaeria archaeon]|nr:30S ribosomal protein S8e [Nitrososphaeria archaeon]